MSIPSSPLRVLMVHNTYQQRGGEDSVVESEIALLREHGHQVEVYRRHNDDIEGMSRGQLLADTLWSRRTTQDLRALASSFRPDIVHVHNTLPLVSPSVFWAAHDLEIPVVQTLHNFRTACLDATFLRDGKICEDCLGTAPWRGVVRACYRDSVPQSAVMATMLMAHRAAGTLRRKVTRFIALNEFCRGKLIQAGLPADRVSVKPNFVEWRPPPEEGPRHGGLYVGRLSPEKGIEVLLAAAARHPGLQLKVAGTGPFEAQAQAQWPDTYLGFRPLSEVLGTMASSSYLVLPSICYESFPRTLVEAYACALPVVASRLGALPELVKEGETGLLFNPNDPDDLAAKLAWADTHPEDMRRMGLRARQMYENDFAPEINHAQLMGIYRQAMGQVTAIQRNPGG